MKSEGFGVVKNEKRVFLDFLKTFLLKKEGIEVLKTEKRFFS